MFYLLDGRLCSMLPLDQFESDGDPMRGVYFYKGGEGGALETRYTNSLAKVEMSDDGSSWTFATMPRGAHLYIESHEHVHLGEVYTHLVNLYNRRKALADEAQGGGTVVEEAEVNDFPEFSVEYDPADLNRDGIVTPKEQRKYERLHGGN